jgi:hypothetical protein
MSKMKKARFLAPLISLVLILWGIPAFAAAPYVQSDTTVSFSKSQGQTYQVQFTVHGTHADPHIAAGNGRVLQTLNTVKTKDAGGNDVYYFKVKAIGSAGSSSAIYTTLPGQAPVRHFVISIIKTYSPGMYKVGTEIPAGEYVLIPTKSDTAYFEITKDSSGKSDSIIANDYFSGRSIVTVADGEYFNVAYSTVYKINEAPAVNKAAKELSDGMYRVGIDIPAGEYKIAPTDSSGGYYEISSDSTHKFESIIGNGTVDNQQYLTIENGQYLKLQRTKIIS